MGINVNWKIGSGGVKIFKYNILDKSGAIIPCLDSCSILAVRASRIVDINA